MDFNYLYRELAVSTRRNKELSDKLNEALKEIEYLKHRARQNSDDWLPGDDIEAYGEWFTLVVEESSYYAERNEYQVYRLLDESYSLSERMTLEDLRNNYTNVRLEQRLK